MQEAAKSTPLNLDIATYVSPSEIKASEGRDCGMFIRRKVA